MTSKKDIEALYPLSPMQQGMLFHSMYAPEAGMYLEQYSCVLQQSVDVPLLQQAWQQLVDTHPVLRTSIHIPNGSQPLQVVHRQATLSWSIYDYRGFSALEQETQMQSLLQNDRRQGFTLEQAPLMRMMLFRVAEQTYHLIWTFHHLLLDGWSTSLLLKKVFTCYEALCRGEFYQMHAGRPYRDYITWLQQQDQSRAEDFWRAELQGFEAPTSFAARSRRSDQPRSPKYGEQELTLSEDLSADLRSLARQHHLTLNTIVQGAWALLLNRYTGARDIIFGVTVAGRPAALKGVEAMVGLFINTLPMRVSFLPDSALLPWLLQLQAHQLEMFQYDYCSLAQIQEWSAIPRGRPLFESLVVFENYPVGPELQDQMQRLEITNARFSERGNYPFNLLILPETAITLRLVYNDTHFDTQSIQRLLLHLRNLLINMTADPNRLLSSIPLLGQMERQQILQAWNQTQAPYPQAVCLHNLFEIQAEKTPDSLALSFLDAQLTYRALEERANQLAHYLQAVGIGPESLVGLYVERSLELVVAILAIFKAGGSYLPLDPAYPAERLIFMMQDAGVSLLISQSRLPGSLPMHETQVVCLEEQWLAIKKQPTSQPPCSSRPENRAYVIYTSGSTGQPKGTEVTHRGLCNLAEAHKQIFAVQPQDTILQFASLSFDASIWEIVMALCSGARLCLTRQEQLLPGSPLEDVLQEQAITVATLAPSVLAALPRDIFPVLHTLIVAGEPCTPELVARFAPGRRFFNAYGPTEATVCATIARCLPDDPRPSIGRPIINLQIYLLSAQLEPVPVGVPGELYIGGPGLARGYLARPELTAARFVPHPFSTTPGERLYRTGDLACYRPDGSIEFMGRVDHQVKLRGFRIELGEIEAALSLHPDVQDAVVLLREVSLREKLLVAYIVPRSGNILNVVDLRGFLHRTLPSYMLPAIFVSLDAFPLTPSNKIDYKALPQPDRQSDEIMGAPRTEQERLLAEIWAALLGHPQVSIFANFFELGGDSILSIQIVDRARRLGMHFTPRDVFEHPTIAELVNYVQGIAGSVSEQGIVTGSIQLTPIQHWFFERNLSTPQHWNQSMMLQGPGDLDPFALQAAVQAILVHHDALRMRFVKLQDSWQQINEAPPSTPPFIHRDLAGMLETEQALFIEQVAAEMQARLDLGKGSLMQVALFTLGSQRPCRILMIIHHLVVDTLSWRILLEDLQTAYLALIQKSEPQLPAKTTSFKEWSGRLQSYASTAALQQELDYWLQLRWDRHVPLPLDYGVAEAANLEATTNLLHRSLSSAETRTLLRDIPSVYNTQMNDLLLTALAQTFSAWTGRQALLVDLEGHGRESIMPDLDLSHTVGWFTTLYPVVLEVEANDPPGQALQAIKEQLRRIPQHGIGYGLLRYLSNNDQIRQQLQARPEAEVSFNYLGQFDQVLPTETLFTPASEYAGPDHSPGDSRAYVLEVSSLVADEQLHVTWKYSQNLHQQSTIAMLADTYMYNLRALIQHCQSPEAGGYTPSDFPLARLDAQRLNKLSALLSQLSEE